MKKIIGLSVLLIVAGVCRADAQDTTKKAGSEIKKGVKSVGNKAAEIASKGKAVVVDKVYDGKEGPHGETIYIDKHSKYYWINKKGHKVYVAKTKLKSRN